VTDPIADMLTRIRNATHIRRRQVKMPASRIKAGIAQVLKDEGYIRDFDTVVDARQGVLRVDLKYGPRGEPVIHDLQRVSKPGCRVYRGVAEFPRILDGLGICVLSTNQGVLSDRACRAKNVGGELLCWVY
jgi:small subunit ribosomal protein S8